MQKIAVLGLGLNGLLAAITCKKAGFEVVIFEETLPKKAKKDERTSVLTFETINFLKELKVFETLEKHLSPIFHIYTFEGKEDSILSFDAPELGEKPFGYLIHNFQLKSVLLKIINEMKIQINNKKVENIKTEGGFAFIEEEKFKLILNCLGKNGNFTSKKKVLNYGQTAFVFNISHTQNHKSIAVESFMPGGPLAILPLLNSQNSAVIWTVKNEIADFLKSKSKEDFLKFFKQECTRMGHIGEVSEVISEVKTYPLSLSFTPSQASKRQILLGDSFNSIHPVAGQGFNMSVKDIKNLYENLQKASILGLDIGSESFLSNFAKNNLKHHIEMNLFTHSLVKIFSNKSQILKTVRNLGIFGINEISPIRKMLMKKASGV